MFNHVTESNALVCVSVIQLDLIKQLVFKVNTFTFHPVTIQSDPEEKCGTTLLTITHSTVTKRPRARKYQWI